MLRFVAVKKRQFHQQRLKGCFRKVGADDIRQWTPPTPSCCSTSKLQLLPSVKRDIVRSNDTRTLRLRRQSSITLSSAYSRYLSAKPLPILRSGSLKKEKYSIRKRLASMNRNKPLPPIPFQFLSPDKTVVEPEPFGSSFALSLSLKAVLNEDDHGKAPVGEADLIPSEERLESRSDQIERPNKDGNKANPTAEKIQVKAIANSTVDSTIANLTSIKVEATCPPFSSAEVTSHPNSHSQNNQKNLASNINVDTGNKKDKDQDEPPYSKIDDLPLRSPSFKAHAPSLDMFRFPLRRSPLEGHSLLYRPRVLHAHRQSLPPTMSTTPLLARALDLHTLSPSDMGPYSAACSVSTLPKEFKDNRRDDTSSPPSKAHPADKARPLDMASPSMVPKSLLRRSESCSHISHRPTLSLDSSKKALLSLQARRVNKPDAKVVRLPDIQTTTTSYSSSVVVLLQGTDALDTPPGEDLLHGDALLKSHDDHDHEYQLQVSDRDRTVTNALLMDVTTMDAFKAVSGGDMTSLEMRRSNVKVSANKESQSLEPSMTGLEALSGAPVVDAGEINRFFKRSHALRELVTTEETYVYDLETLTKVHLRVLETKHWFPQSLFGRLVRCTLGILKGQRTFLIRLGKVQLAETDRKAPLEMYRSMAEAFSVLQQAILLYSEFCEVRTRTFLYLDKHAPAGSALHLLLQKEGNDLLAQQKRRNSREDLKDYLIKPIQRICRYPLLLHEVSRLTSTGDPEYQLVQQTYDLMKSMAHDLDEAQRVVDRMMMTERFLKKLPESTYPRKANGSQQPGGNSPRLNSHPILVESNPHLHDGRLPDHDGAYPESPLSWPTDSNVYLFEGLSPSPITKAMLSEAGSIVLAGALEFVLMPTMPIRIKYYGCFLFETMLLVVKPKSRGQYELRQWLPLWLCELQETTCLDGYTRFGWRILFDHYRIDLGAYTVTEQHVWVTTLQARIRAAKEAYERATRDGTRLPPVASSLPWAPTYFASNVPSTTLASSRHPSQPSPIPSPSPWSAYSSAIPSPLMPPPPAGQTNTTLVMAPVMGDNIWEVQGPGSALANYANGSLEQLHPTGSGGEHVAIGGMAGNSGTFQKQRARSPSRHPHDQDPHHHPQSHQYPTYPDFGLAQQQQMLHPSNMTTSSPASSWLLSEHRTRSNSFDVSRVFASSANHVIKQAQRTQVQSYFKEMWSESVWTTVSTPTSAGAGPPMGTGTGSGSGGGTSASLQYGSPMAASSPQAIRSSSMSKQNPFSYFMASSSPSVVSAGAMGGISPSVGIPGMSSVPTAGNENETVSTTAASATTGMTSSSSATSLTRLLRKSNSGSHHGRLSNSSESGGFQEKSEWDRRRNSATAAIAATLTLNFRSNHKHHHTIHSTSTPSSRTSLIMHQQHYQQQQQDNDTTPTSTPTPTNAPTTPSSQATSEESNNTVHNSPSNQRLSIKSRAQFFEKRTSLPSFSSTNIAPQPPPSSPSYKAIKRGPSQKFFTKISSAPDPEPLLHEQQPLLAGSGVVPVVEAPDPALDMLCSLQSAGEAAKSRRARGGSRGGSPTSAAAAANSGISVMTSCDISPALVDSPVQLPETNNVDMPKDFERLGAMGRVRQKCGLGGYSTARKSRSNSSNSSISSLRSFGATTTTAITAITAITGQHPGTGQHLGISDQQQETFDHGSSNQCLLRRSSTWESDSTTQSASSESSSSPLRMTSIVSNTPPSLPGTVPQNQSDYPMSERLATPRVGSRSTHSRASSNTDCSVNGPTSTHGSLLALTPSVSVTSCCSLSSCPGSSGLANQYHSAYKEDGSLATSRSLNHLHYNSNNNNGSSNKEGAHHRRKSISILQHLTQSASQKFRTLMRTPSGLRRRTVVSVTDEQGHEGEQVVERYRVQQSWSSSSMGEYHGFEEEEQEEGSKD
ncbi:T-lymphoma invasion and metastasis-inducing protein 2 [Podila minutissima]|uniref:T-lymphoma invasion and metastasis-inducing protein 2 n=1 Tax=Podila minutissima TaxID=64525 RepID=A0A9P5SJV7_9FUNG|nr:T-lymphoma invasion and metastasis-inducing protein 2 [Podila minutissima]